MDKVGIAAPGSLLDFPPKILFGKGIGPGWAPVGSPQGISPVAVTLPLGRCKYVGSWGEPGQGKAWACMCVCVCSCIFLVPHMCKYSCRRAQGEHMSTHVQAPICSCMCTHMPVDMLHLCAHVSLCLCVPMCTCVSVSMSVCLCVSACAHLCVSVCALCPPVCMCRPLSASVTISAA